MLIADGHHRYETAVAYRDEQPEATRTFAVLVSTRSPGLEIFPRDIYYLDRIPVYVDYGAIGWIVVWTLLVSLVWSIYPALRAAAADPVEAIRDE